jgi:hypothetical protein
MLVKLEDLAFLLSANGSFFSSLYEVLLGNFGGFIGGLDNGGGGYFFLD